jgi:hypothetical protein
MQMDSTHEKEKWSELVNFVLVLLLLKKSSITCKDLDTEPKLNFMSLTIFHSSNMFSLTEYESFGLLPQKCKYLCKRSCIPNMQISYKCLCTHIHYYLES